MRSRVLFRLLVGGVLVSGLTLKAEEKISSEQAISILEQRAESASDREQSYIYAELVHELVRYSADQYASGDVERATTTLKRTQGFAARVRITLGTKAKKLKAAQIFLRRAAYRLTDLLHSTSYEDRKLVQETLSVVQEAERDTLAQVFRR